MVSKHLIKMPFFHSKIRALLTFMGVPNCGKRYMAELLVKADERLETFQAFQMDQYNDAFSTEQPFSSTIENDVVAFVQAHPKSLLFFEDIDKADTQVQLALSMLFSEAKPSTVDFSEVVVVMSTTRLSALLKRADLQTLFRQDPLQAHTFVMERLAQEEMSFNGNKERVFNAKLLSLLNEGALIPFNPLSLTALIKIGAHSLHTLSYQFNQQSGVQMEYKNIDTFISLLTLSLAPCLNARYIQTKLPETLFNGVYTLLKQRPKVTHITYTVSLKAKAFVRDALSNQPLLLKKIGKQQWRIRLEWSLHVKGNQANYTLKHAFYTKEQLHVNTQDALCISEVTFQDIAGQERVKEALREVLTLFKEPERLKHFSMLPPKGMILYGPAGMGKKLLARAFAHEADMPYIVLRDANLFDGAKIHKAYAQAYSSAPAIVILEDIDVQGITSEVISTMNVAPVIEELDALTQSFETPLFTIVSIAQKDDIPDALIKTGRLDICIEVPKLDMQARRFFIEEILKMPHDDNIDVERVVRYISGMGGDA
ncbi:MAG: AAA family ATPase, partial [Epsilonproteobacteria bacterium]|nr:AAA family ATPase [Campylobacterota bacterium]